MIPAIMAIDQYGQTIHGLDPRCPKKALAARLGVAASTPKRIYRDLQDGGSRHTGYVVGGRWFEFYRVLPWKGDET